MCVVNGSQFCTPVLMNMCNITFQVIRLSTLSLTRVQKKIVTIIFVVKSLKGFGWNNIGSASVDGGPASHQHWANVSCYLVFWRRGEKRPRIMQQSENTVQSCCFNDEPASNIEPEFGG